MFYKETDVACHEEHCYLMQVAIERSEWGQASRNSGGAFAKYTGWKSLGRDVYNRMATISDSVGDWMWHMSPWAEWALQYGAQKVNEDLRHGDEDAAALKAAFLTHYVVDPLAVSHTWLYLIGEIWEFESDQVLHERFHDPVENLVGKYLDELTLDPPGPYVPYAQLFPACLREAFAIGRRILDEFCGQKNYLPLVKEGVRNSARCMPSFMDDLYRGVLPCTDAEGIAWAGRRWMARLFLDWTGERILRELFKPETIAALKKDMGYQGADIFFCPGRCAPAAIEDFRFFQQAREAWREKMGIAQRVKV